MSCFTRHCDGSCWVGWKLIWLYVPLFYWLYIPVLLLLWLQANVSEFLCQISHDVTNACTMLVRKNRYNRCVYWAWGGCMQMCTCMSHTCVVARTRTAAVSTFDLTQPWTLLPWRSIHIVYPTPSLSSRLMHGGVKHLVMLNHSWGNSMLGAIQSDSTATEGGGRRNTISPSGRVGGFVGGEWQWCGGQDGTGGKREGVQVGVKLVRVSMENKKY